MNHVIKFQPVLEPVKLDDMRHHLGISQIDDNTRDVIIAGRIVSARTWAEQYTRRAFVTQTIGAYAGDFPDWSPADRGRIIAQSCRYHRPINLRGPLQSVTFIKYVDTNGVLQTLDPSQYQVDLIAAQIVPVYGQKWPSVRWQPNAVEIEYVAGYGVAGGSAADSTTAVPEPIKDAIRFIVGQWELFQTSIEGVVRPFTIPNAAKQLLDSYVDMREVF